jgi:hypothetical protein
MTRKNGTILTIASALLVGCPSCFCILFGLISAAGAGTYELGSDVGNISPGVGILILLAGGLGLLVPAAVWFFTVRGKPADA